MTTTTSTAVVAVPVNQTVFGKTIPLLFGAARVLGAPFWSGDIVTNDDGSRVVTYGAILGQRDPFTDSVTLLRVWMDGILAYTNDGTYSNTAAFKFTFYPGSETQKQDPTIVAKEGAARTPAFRDRMYIIIHQWNVPEGAKFPEVTCEVSQHVTIQATRFVTTFEKLNGDFSHGSTARGQFVDIPSGLQWCIDYPNHVVRVFDINRGIEIIQFAALIPIACTGRYTPYYFGAGAIGGPDENYLAVGDLYGNYAYATNAEISYGGYGLSFAQSGHPMVDGSQFIWCQELGPTVQIARFDPSSFSIGVVSTTTLGGSFTGTNCVPCVVPTNILSPNNDYGMAFFANDRQITIGIQLLNASAIIGNRTLKYTDADGVLGGSSTIETLIVDTDIVNPVASLDLFFETTLADPTWGSCAAKAMVIDPVAGAWLAVLYSNEGAGYAYWVRFNTVFSQLGVQFPGHTTVSGEPVPNPKPALPDVTYLTLTEYLKLDGVDYVNVGDNIRAFGSVPDTDTTICFTSALSTFTVLDMSDGSFTVYPHGDFQNVDGTDYGTSPAFDPYAIWNEQKKGFYYCNGGSGLPEPGFITLFQSPSNTNTLYVSNYLTSLSVLANFPQNSIETDGIDDALVGSIINQPTSFLDLITSICEVFRIDIIESEGKLKYKRRIRGPDFSVDRVLTINDLAPIDQSGTDDGTVIQKDRDATVTIPTVIQLTYLDSDNEYQLGTQSAKRTIYPVKTSNGVTSEAIGLPIAMHAVTALYWAEFCLFDRWSEALVLTLRLSSAQIDLEPGDYIQLNTDNYGDYTAKITEVDLNADMSLTVLLSTILAIAPDNQNLNDIQVASTDAGVYQSTGQTGFFSFWVVDNLFLTTTTGGEIDYTIYVFSSVPVNVYLYNSVGFSQGVTFNPTANGIATNAIGAMQPWQLDRPDFDTVLTVQMSLGAPSIPTSDANWRIGVGCSLLIGSPGRWELIYYRTVAHNTDGSWSLSGFIRGQRGTDTVNARKAGETCLFISGVVPGIVSSTEVTGRNAQLVAAYPNRAPTDPSSKSTYVKLAGNSVKPWAPVQVRAAYSGSDIVLTWIRRDRQDYFPFVADATIEPQPLSETVESYDVDIINDADGTVKRTFAALLAGPTVTYTAAEITADALSFPLGLHVRVYQNSALVGRGIARDVVCPVS